jgi:hypothetical protein
MIDPEIYAHHLTISSKNCPPVVPHSNRQSGISGHLLARWSVIIGEHAISLPFHKNLNLHKKFEQGRGFESFSNSVRAAFFEETLHFDNPQETMSFQRSSLMRKCI